MGSVTLFAAPGDDRPPTRWRERHVQKLVRYARRKLQGAPRGIADEEDIALVAFTAFCLAAKEGRYPNLADRDDLWRLLLCITARRALDQKRKSWRDHQVVLGESALPGWDSEAGVQALGEVLGDTPSPEVIAASTEMCRQLLASLDDPVLQEIAIAKLEGYTNKEIAQRLGCGLRTVERKLRRIRQTWETEVD